MPTGYTAKLIEEGQAFPEFVMTCARAFGALVEMRDDPLDAPIPDKFEVPPYHADQLRLAQQQASELANMSEEQRIEYGSRIKKEEIESREASIAKNNATNAKIAAMARQVEAWTPPTSEHEDLKAFMLEQLRASLESNDYLEERLDQVKRQSPLGLWHGAHSQALRSIVYHAKENEDAYARAAKRTTWVRELRRSLENAAIADAEPPHPPSYRAHAHRAQ
jgi:hypothetical protein